MNRKQSLCAHQSPSVGGSVVSAWVFMTIEHQVKVVRLSWVEFSQELVRGWLDSLEEDIQWKPSITKDQYVTRIKNYKSMLYIDKRMQIKNWELGNDDHLHFISNLGPTSVNSMFF